MNFYLSHTHNAPVSVVETNDEGQETWVATGTRYGAIS